MVENYIEKAVNWQMYVNNNYTLDPLIYNTNKGHFLKADELEHSIADFSNGKIQFKDEQGRDLYVPKFDLYVEVKYSSHALYGKTGWRECIKGIQLMKFRGNNHYNVLPEDYSQFIMVLEEQCGILVNKDAAKKYIVDADDGLYLKKFPIEKSYKLFGPLAPSISEHQKDKIIQENRHDMEKCRINWRARLARCSK